MTTKRSGRPAAARIRTLAVAGAAVAALAVAACGGSSAGSSGSAYGAASPAPASSAKPSGAASVALRSTTLGKVLADGKGQTLYLFEADKGNMSTCNGACSSSWPALTTAATPKAGPGISAAKLGTTKRSDGTTEVTYNGHPLYTYTGDTSPGATTGEGSAAFGAEWYVLSASGSKVVSGG